MQISSWEIARRALAAAAIFALFSFVLSPSTVFAESPPGEDDATEDSPEMTVSDEIVVSANRLETPRDDVGSTVTVITAEDIERHRWQTLGEALRTVPGVSLARSGGPGQSTSAFVRGGNSSHTLVLLDGARLNSVTTGAYDLADLSTAGIERIEILRGPQSTLYGSEAMSGVISILSKRGSGPARWHGLTELGDDEHHRLRLGAEGGGPDFDWSLAVSDQATDGVSAAAGGLEADAWENTTVSGRAGWRLGDRGRLDVDLRRIESEVEIDGFDFFAGPVDDLDAVNTRDAWIGGVSAELELGSRWTQSVRLGVAEEDLSGSDPTNPFGNFTIESRTLELSTQADVDLTRHQVLSVGAELEERDGGTVGTFDADAEIMSLYVQDRIVRGRLGLTLGARHDDHSEFGGETTWRVAASVDAGPASDPRGRLHASWGTGFKAPTFNDLFFPFFGNPQLEPETSEGLDLGYEHRFGGQWGSRWTLDVTAFDLDFEDLIVFDFVAGQPLNVASASSRGVELAADYDGESWTLAASHTWNETQDETTGLQLARRPEHRTVVDLTWRPSRRSTDGWSATVTALAVANRIDSDASELDDYERVDLTVQYRLGERWQPYVRVVNLFDQEYEEIAGFGTRGTTAFLGLALNR